MFRSFFRIVYTTCIKTVRYTESFDKLSLNAKRKAIDISGSNVEKSLDDRFINAVENKKKASKKFSRSEYYDIILFMYFNLLSYDIRVLTFRRTVGHAAL